MNQNDQKPLCIIVAIAEEWAIGKNNDLLCHLPNDLKRFKALTSGHKVLMGENTYISLPKRPLPNRTNIVLSLNPDFQEENILIARSIEEAIQFCDSDNENFVMGGGIIYRLFLPIATKLYLTRIHKKFEADVYFPEINFDDFDLIESELIQESEENPIAYTYETWLRK